MIDPQVAWDKISCFESPEELKDYFVGEQVFGVRKRAFSCPIAIWMANTTGKHTSVAGTIRVGVEPWAYHYIGEADADFYHTRTTLAFVKAFDQGLYPELDVEMKAL